MLDDTITGNGDGAGFEHGIYAGPTATGYTITRNQIGDNAGADIKAAGGPGLVADNRLTSSMFGLVISDNPAVVTVQYNLVQGSFQHGILMTTGATAARARLWNNTVQQTGRSTASGNASAVFIVSAAQLEARNNLFAYTNPTCSARRSCSTTRRSWGLYCATPTGTRARSRSAPRGLERRARHVPAVAALSQRDAASSLGAAHVHAAAASPRRTSERRRAPRSGLTHDLVGTPLPALSPPDIERLPGRPPHLGADPNVRLRCQWGQAPLSAIRAFQYAAPGERGRPPRRTAPREPESQRWLRG